MQKQVLLESLRQQGFSEKIINAFEKVRREDFIPHNYKVYAYEDHPLPIGEEQTISQPYTIAFMLSLLKLKPNSKFLEIGSGSGYVLALVNEIITNGKLYGIEIKRSLALSSQKILSHNPRINIINTDGSNGLPEKSPFDRVLVSASADNKSTLVPLITQLKDNGILVAPVQNSIWQIKKENNIVREKEFHGFVFVPLVQKN